MCCKETLRRSSRQARKDRIEPSVRGRKEEKKVFEIKLVLLFLTAR